MRFIREYYCPHFRNQHTGSEWKVVCYWDTICFFYCMILLCACICVLELGRLNSSQSCIRVKKKLESYGMARNDRAHWKRLTRPKTYKLLFWSRVPNLYFAVTSGYSVIFIIRSSILKNHTGWVPGVLIRMNLVHAKLYTSVIPIHVFFYYIIICSRRKWGSEVERCVLLA